MSSPTCISSFAQVALGAKDASALVAYFRDTIGLPFLFEAGGMHFLQAGAARLMIYAAPEGERVGGDAIVYFEPADWSAAEARLEEQGVPFAHPAQVLMREPGREYCLRPFKDPEGHNLALMGWRAA